MKLNLALLILTFICISSDFLEAQIPARNIDSVYISHENITFKKGDFLVSPGIAFVKGTKNNLGFDIEYALSNTLGIVGSLSTTTETAFDNKYYGGGFGLRLHSGYSSRTKNIDIVPGLYWAKVFGYEKASSFGVGVDFRTFLNEHVGFGFGLAKAFQSGTKLGKGITLIIK
jgi:hypothetical protein